MANELKFGNKVVFLNGLPLTLPVAASDPGSATAGDLYYNSGSTTIRYYNGSAWSDLATGGAAANTALSNLASVAINVTLLPGTDNSINLGSAAKSWALGYIHTLNDGSDVASVSAYSRVLRDTSGVASVDWAGRLLVDSGAATKLSWDATGVKFNALTASTVPYLDASKYLVSSAVTPTELGFLSGVTSAIQTQLNAKAADNIVIKKDGSVTYTANQPMGGFKLTGLGAGTTAGDSVRYEQAILVSGANAFAANQSHGGFRITNLADPTSAQDGATKAYVDAVAAGLKPKAAVRAATLVNGTLATAFANGSVIDGVTLATGNRILIKNQTSAADNGIYIVAASGAPSRAPDFDSLSPIDEINGAYTFVQEGTQAGQGWVETGTVATIGTDPINFVYFNDVTNIIAGDMLSRTGNTLSVDLLTNGGLKSSNPGNVAGQLQVSLEASSPSLAVNGSNELGIATGGITNTHVAAGAAIALSKLATLTASRALVSDGSGVISVSTVTSATLAFLDATSSVQTQLNGKANTALSNLASTAVNADISLASDKAFNLGTSSLRWNNLFVGTVDGGSNLLVVKTSGGNANVQVNANGTGTFDVAATKLRRSVNGADTTNFMEDQYFDALTLAANTSSATEVSSSLSFALASFDSAVVNYKIKEATSNKVRVGQFIVTTDGTVASSSDQFSESAVLGSALGLQLTADVSGGNVRILYNNTNASNAATMRCNIRRFRT